MAKYSFQDVIPPDRKKRVRKVKDVEVDEEVSNDVEIEKMEEDEVLPPPRQRVRKVTKKKSSGKGKWVAAVIGIAVLVGGYFAFFTEGAKVSVTIKTDSIPVNVSAASSTLPYKVLASEKTDTATISTTGSPVQVDKKATGTIIVYNKSAASQILVATTRFQTPGGLIYHLDKQATVPAAKGTTPGSVEVSITADKSGDDYNISKSDFTIPGFKGTAKFDNFYGRSKTEMSGGFSGMMAQVSDADLKAANDKLQASLLSAANDDMKSQLPDGYVYFQDGGIRTSYTSTITPGANGKSTVNGKLVASAAAFNQSDVQNLIFTSLGQNYHFDNLNSLKLSLRNTVAVTSFVSSPSLLVDLAGTLTIGQSFNPEDLQKLLAGKAKAQLPEILKLYPEITKADANVRPVWKSSFPENYKNIQIIVAK